MASLSLVDKCEDFVVRPIVLIGIQFTCCHGDARTHWLPDVIGSPSKTHSFIFRWLNLADVCVAITQEAHHAFYFSSVLKLLSAVRTI